MESRDDLFRKIRGLLRKAEGTDNEHEQAAFLRKAQELMIVYAVDEEAVWASDPDREPPKPIELKVEIKDKTGKQWLRILLGACARHNRCRTWYMDGEPFVQVVGFESDALFVELLYVSLKAQMDLQLAIGLVVKSGGENARTFRANFIEGFARRVNQRMEESDAALRGTTTSTGASTALVVAGREARVQAWLDSQYPGLRTVSVKSTAAHSRGAQALGAEAANNADITGGRRSVVEGRKELPSGR